MDNIYIHVIDSFTVLFFIYIYLILFNKNHSYLFYQIIVYYKRISKSILFFQIKYEYQITYMSVYWANKTIYMWAYSANNRKNKHIFHFL